jgi:phosphoglycolate phosphatase-like HAD superfamily hydrolase
MLELLTYLRAKGFKTFIVSGGGQEFLRVFTDKTYGVPPEWGARPARPNSKCWTRIPC